MGYRQAVLAVAIVALLLAPTAPRGEEDDDLRALFTQEIKSLNARNMDDFVASMHDGIVVFGVISPFPIDGKEAYGKAVREFFAPLEHFFFAPINPAFRVMGPTGVAWGHYGLTTKRKDGPLKTDFGRYICTYTKVEGQWRMVSMHFSPLQTTY